MDQRTKTPTQRNVDLKAIHQRLKSGHVLRYHAKPEIADGQNVAAHTWRAMVILQTLWPDSSKNAMIHMMYHDVAEAETGDIPATTKWNYPQFAETLQQIEYDYENKLDIGFEKFPVDTKERDMCDIADKLELTMHCFRLMQTGNTFAHEVFNTGVRYLTKTYLGNDENRSKYRRVEQILIELMDAAPSTSGYWPQKT